MEDKSEHHPVANIPKNTEGSELVENCGMGHAKQPHGSPIGAGEGHSTVHPSGYARAAHHHEHFGKHHRSSGAHRIGHRGK